MHHDQQGHALSGATTEAAALYCEALRAFNIYRGDPLAVMERVIETAPDFHMAKVFKAQLYALSTEPDAMQTARELMTALKQERLDERTASHVKALDALFTRGWHAAANALDSHNIRWPHDVLALQTGHLIDFLRGNARHLRDRIAAVLPRWSGETPGYAALLGMYAFGLEESGDYARAEETGRRAAELDPFDCWAHHAVAHVMEMQGRTADGIEWLRAHESGWSGEDNFFRVHNWWHLAVFHLGLEQGSEALRLYDARVRKDRSPVALDLIDASAMLWRLHLSGVDVGDRPLELARTWTRHADGRTYLFNDWHAYMTYLQAGWDREADALLRAVRATAAGRDETAELARRCALPLMEGFVAYWRGDERGAVEHLHSARFLANALGGSHAQRDIIDLTLMQAALRGGMRGYAESLAYTRLALKPHSPVNQRFLIQSREPVGQTARRAA